MPVLQPLPVDIEGTPNIACAQPIMCIKEDEIATNCRYNEWKSWILREQINKEHRRKKRKPNK